MDTTVSTPESVADRVAHFVEKTLLTVGAGPVDRSVDMFEEGIVDSFGFVEMVSFIEKEFGIELSDDDLESDEIATIEGLTQIILDKAGANG